jgi:hypothetical protein
MAQQTGTLTLGKTCTACGKERKGKALRYDPITFDPYCENAYICNDQHPNSPKNLIERQAEFVLVGAEEANEAYKAHLLDVYEDKSVVEQIQKMLTHPITIRILTPAMAKFLIDYAHENETASQSDAIRNCVQTVMDNKNQFVNEHRELEKEDKKKKTAKAVAEEVSKPAEKVKKTEAADPDSFGEF